MCGIIGYAGKGDAAEIIYSSLKRLEYRGYDSAGIAVVGGENHIRYRKCAGNLSVLSEELKQTELIGTVGIGHTRWATHGKPSRTNAHPHFDCNGEIAVVHNGIIENYHQLKSYLISQGHRFVSDTDSEVIAHLIEQRYDGDLLSAVAMALSHLEGSFAIAAIAASEPDIIVTGRRKSPLVIGLGEDANFAASDVPAILPYTRRVIYISDDELARLTASDVMVYDATGRELLPEIVTVDIEAGAAEKQGYEHFMLKEIYEQPHALQQTISSLVDTHSREIGLPHLAISDEFLKSVEQVIFVACGTAWHAAIVGKYAFNEYVGLSTLCEVASELRYTLPPITEKTLIIAISQSGETADTLAAVGEARRLGAKCITICNVPGSSITREADGIIYTRAGPEIGVASTKAYTSQLSVVILLALHLAILRGRLNANRADTLLEWLLRVPSLVKYPLADDATLNEIAQRFKDASTFLYIGRRYNFATAFEGALKLKEISYIHAEGYGAGEMKHGPIALVQSDYPTVAITTAGPVYEKMLGNIQEIKARGGPLVAICNEGDSQVEELVDYVIEVPDVPELFSPIINVIPLQLLAYKIAVLKGCNVDQPRNLAKSVTVE